MFFEWEFRDLVNLPIHLLQQGFYEKQAAAGQNLPYQPQAR
jgi:hypothetical protein